MKNKNKNICTIGLLLMIIIIVFICIGNFNSNKNENFDNKYTKSSTYDVGMGSSQKYGWGEANISSTPKPVPPRRPPRRPNPPLPEPSPPMSGEKYIFNDFRGSCENCDIVKHPEINRYVLKSSIPPGPDMTKYILKSQIPPRPNLSKYILKSQVPACPDMGKYILKSKIPPCPNVFKHLMNDEMRGNVYSCGVKTPLLPSRCPKPRNGGKLVRITDHPDFHKYELRDEFKKSKEMKMCHKGEIEYGAKLPGISKEQEYSKY